MHFYLTSGGQIAPHSRRLKRTWSFPILLGVGGGAVFGKGRPEVSYCPLKTLKISECIWCIHLTTLMRLHVMSGGRIAPHSRRLNCTWSFLILLGGRAAFVKPEKGRPEISYCPLRVGKISEFIYCIHLIMLMHFHVTPGGRIAPHSRQLRCMSNAKRAAGRRRTRRRC